MPSTFGPGLAVDPVTLAPVPNALIRVMDTEGTVEYATQDIQGTTQPVFTDHRGQYPQFQIAESVPVALLVSPPYMQRIASLEALQGASQAISDFTADTGALTVPLESGYTAHATLNTLRRVGSTVFLQLGWQGAPATNAIITYLPDWAMPSPMGMTGSTLGTSVFLRANVGAPDVYGYGLKPASPSMDYARLVYHTTRPFPTASEIQAYKNGA